MLYDVKLTQQRFRWVACQMDFLCECSSDRDRREALEKLPPDLPSSYLRILERANKASSATQSLVSRTLQWICYAKQPLSTSQFLQALSIQIGDTDFDPSAKPTEDDVLHWCSSLVRLNKSLERIEFAHFTVEEFLSAIDPVANPEFAQYQLSNRRADIMIAQTCLICLNWKSLEILPIPTDEEEFHLQMENITDVYPFYRYASHNWDSHARKHLDEAQLVELTYSLFDLEICNRFRLWALVWFEEYILHDDVMYHDLYLSPITRLSPLHMAACLALSELCKWLILGGAIIDDDVGFGTPLWFAILGHLTLEESYEAVIDVLMSEADEVRARKSPVVQLLLEAGSDPCKRRRFVFDGSLVGLVAEAEHFGKVQNLPLLLNAGASVSGEDIEAVVDIHRNWQGDGDLEFCRDKIQPKGSVTRLFMDATFTSMASLKSEHQELLYDLAVLFLQCGVETPASRSVLDFDFQGRASDDLCKRVVTRFNEAIEKDNCFGFDRSMVLCFLDCIQTTAHDEDSFEQVLWAELRIAMKCESLQPIECLVDKMLDLSLVDKYGNTPLHVALDTYVYHTNLRIVQLVIDRGVDVTASNNQQEVALHIAAGYDDIEMIELIWAHSDPAALEAQTAYGRTPLKIAIESGRKTSARFLLEKYAHRNRHPIKSTLHFAITHGNADILELLVEQGLDIEEVNDEDLPPLLQASLGEGSLCAFSLLLNRGANHSSQDRNGNAPIHILSQSCDTLGHKKLQVLLRHKCDLENRNHEGLTALIIASMHNNPEAAKLLLESGADPCSTSHTHHGTALHWSAFVGCSAITELLLQHGAGIEARTEDGSTPLLIAAQQKQWHIVRQLIEAGANLNTKTAAQNSVLHFAASAGSAETTKLLLNICPSLDLEQQAEHGATALMLTGWSANLETFDVLLECGAKLDRTCRSGTIAHFSVAAHEDHIRLALLQHQIDWNSKAILDSHDGEIPGAFPLHVAAAKGWNNAIIFLLQNCLNEVDVFTEDGYTPLVLAIKTGLTNTVELLLEAGANPNICIKSTGRTPLHTAAELGLYEVVQKLLSFGASLALGEYNNIANHDYSWRSCFPTVASLIDNKMQENASRVERNGAHRSHLTLAGAGYPLYDKLPLRPLFLHQPNYASKATQTTDILPLPTARSSSKRSLSPSCMTFPSHASSNSSSPEAFLEQNPRSKRQRTSSHEDFD
jgi:ankyrin repeat protein